MKTREFISAAAVLLAISGCSKNSEETSTTLTYSYEINGCKTGEHTASSTKEHCKHLADSKLNHGCAEDMRKKEFDKVCSGIGIEWDTDSDSSSAATGGLPADDGPRAKLSCTILFKENSAYLFSGGLSASIDVNKNFYDELYRSDKWVLSYEYLTATSSATATKPAEFVMTISNLVTGEDKQRIVEWDSQDEGKFDMALTSGAGVAGARCEVKHED